MEVTAQAVGGLPEIQRGDDLGSLIVERSPLAGGDVVVAAHKAISKAEGRVRALADVQPGEQARALAAEHGKDPRAVQVVLDESRELLRAARGVLICVTRHGFVCANAGVDVSNAPAPDTVVLLPEDPDRSARALRARLRVLTGENVAVIVSDSFGRAWRHAQCDVAIGCAGLQPMDDWRGRHDSAGRELRATWIARADEIAATADLARDKSSREPVVIVRGLQDRVGEDDGPGATALLRPEHEDLFR